MSKVRSFISSRIVGCGEQSSALIALQVLVVHVPFLQRAFGTVDLTAVTGRYVSPSPVRCCG